MLRIHDTRAKQVESIKPARAVRMYTCGPTVHRRAHVGNLRSYLLSDLIRRVLERQRVRVVACQNITDVGHLAESGEDKVRLRARAEGRSTTELARDYEAAFRADTAALNLRPAEHTPRASETIDQMVELIAKLIERGHAYTVPDGSVFFAAKSFPQALPRRLGAVAARRGRADLGHPVGTRLSRLARRVLRDGAELPRRAHRPAHRRRRPVLPAPRERARPVRRGGRARGRRALGAR
jgi:cysteinyl-tRNA synthetase